MKRSIVRLCSETPIQRLFSRWAATRLPILMMHRFSAQPQPGRTSADSLERFLTLARTRGWSAIRLDELAKRLAAGRLPKRCFCLTVDDGYRDFAEVAHPILAQFQVPATVFLTTSFVDARIWQWWDRLQYVGEQLGHGDMGSHVERLKSIPQAERLREMGRLESQLSTPLPDTPPAPYAAMNWDEVRRLASDGVEFGAHTVHHPILSQLESEEQVRAEIHGSIETLSRELSAPVHSFAYPNGRPQDFDERSLAALRETSLSCAVTTEPRFLSAQSWAAPQGRWTLPRLSYPDLASNQAALLSGFEAAKASLRGE